MPCLSTTDLIAPLAVAGAAFTAGAILGHGVFVPQSSLYCPTISRAPAPSGPRIALTFDDGPWPGSTEPILDALAAAGASATFFVIGRYAQAHPHLLRRIADEGHQIGNHTFDHHRAGLLRGPRYWLDQITRADEAIAAVTGQPPRLFRAPMGFKSPLLAHAIRQTGHTVVAWSRRGYDGRATSAERITYKLRRITPGDIVLLHDGRDPASRRDTSATAAALPTILSRLRDSGLQSVRLDEFITHSPP